MSDDLEVADRPDNYKPPTWEQVQTVANRLREQREPVMAKIWERKKARRGQWEDTLRKIPRTYRKFATDVDLPEIRDMLQRVSGQISGQPPIPQVIPPSAHSDDVRKASREEARLHAMRLDLEDQQDRPTYAMGVDAQLAWSESWISVWPDPTRFRAKGYQRGDDEDPDEYADKYKKTMRGQGIPIIMEDHDPQTILPLRTDRGSLGLCIVESDHALIDIDLGLGYRRIKRAGGARGENGRFKTSEEWVAGRSTLSEPYVGDFGRNSGGITDTTHDTGYTSGGAGPVGGGPLVKKTVYMDPWCYQAYLDGELVEQWEHNYGIVPMFPALSEHSSDRDPAWASAAVIDAPLAIAKQIVLFSAILASNAMQHGFPTPFLKTAGAALYGPNGQPITRTVQMGELNLMDPNEEIDFPFLKAQMMPDFYKHMEMLMDQLSGTTLSNFGKAIGSDMAGYAVAQVRAMQEAVIKTVYTNAQRQWRKIFYFYRHMVRTTFPGGIYLRGAIETAKVGDQEIQYRPVLEYAKEHTTQFTVDVEISEGIIQDEMAERKSSIEMVQAGLWTRRRAQEKTGVEDPQAENEEIAVERMLNSPAADQQVMVMAMAIAAQRYQASRTDMGSAFMQELTKAQQKLMGGAAGESVQNQGAEPQNALPGGQPVSQNPAPQPPPQAGGPSSGPPAGGPGNDLAAFGAPGIPGGVRGGQPQPTPAGV